VRGLRLENHDLFARHGEFTGDRQADYAGPNDQNVNPIHCASDQKNA